MMAGLAARRVNGVAELCFVAAAEGVQVIEQHRKPEPARRTPIHCCRLGHHGGAIDSDIIDKTAPNLQPGYVARKAELGRSITTFPHIPSCPLASRG
jgi:hypothetical protein